jgi:DNA-binding LytR/AlgR family response regulator
VVLVVRVAVVDDDAHYRESLIGYLKRYEQESHTKFRITTFTDGDEILENFTADYDIILMDIAMTYVDGFETAEQIRKMDNEVVIIFITNMPQYAMKGYTVDALDYVLKPISYFAFSQRIDRALARMKKREKRYLSVSIKGGMKKLDISEITYIEVQDHDLLYHTRTDTFASKGTLTEVEQKLSQGQFFRCNKCYLVNLEHVQSVQGGDVEVGKDLIQVSRAKKKELMDALNHYIHEVSK